ncbi:MAG: hypothetical protein ACD_4C00001G0002 [uncultured bacterium (gcode 4)]|uniref:Uncharacterized protein n=1 Tax=uncultured bacterium (gcode 4) TaxID=1234023 RepID=K2F7S5_9BACT|nr:MAG: hypothetical protein ACD_4C00001G0002 [uncultured bacterium (gcode 4)]
MAAIWFFTMMFWIIIIYNPDLIAILLGIFFVIIWANMLFLNLVFKKSNKESFKIWNFEIFRNRPKK